MDLRSLMNDGPAPDKKSSQSSPPAVTPNSAAAVGAGGGARGSGSGPQPALSRDASNGGAPGQQSVVYPAAGFPPPGRNDGKHPAPTYGPPSASGGSQSQPHSRGLTPLRTPGHGPGQGTSYPFPAQQQHHQQPLQSPVTAGPTPQQYRPFDSYASTTPGARPGNPYGAQPSPSQYGPGAHPSQSPTPSSHHSQTPQSMRQSPRAVMGHPPPQHPPHFHPSQPSTPLGPPTHVPRHAMNGIDGASPFHQRTVSGASNGYPARSPAQHQTSITSLIESPTVHPRQSPRRSASEYPSIIDDRARSESVSPKTKVPPRPPSLSSRHSSQHEVHSARSSLQHSTSVVSQADSQNFTQQPQSYPQANVASAVPQNYAQIPGQPAGYPASSNSLLVANKAPPPTALQHQPRPMGMSNLLAPTQQDAQQAPQHHPSHNMPPRQPPTPQQSASIKTEPMQQNGVAHVSPNASNRGIKRSATESETPQPPVKRERRRKYTERPIWARLHPSNPRLRIPGVMPNGPEPRLQPQKQQQQQQPPPRQMDRSSANAPVQPPQQTNGQKPQQPSPAAPGVNFAAPWLEDPPVDHDMLRMRRIMGHWEKTIQWRTPLPSLTKAVTDWLVQQLLNCQDVAQDPAEGQIEIEAKVGRLWNKQTGRRFELPVHNMVVISPPYAEANCTFQSEMQEHEHKAMNDFLNAEVRNTHSQTGRQQLEYIHLQETDNFEKLSKLGLDSLPEAMHRRHLPRDPKLRTTIESNPKTGKVGQVKARIIKVKVADLHIFNPHDDYDLRITMNVECNLMRPNLDPGALVEGPTPDKPNQPARKKDRLSYKHLNGLYQIDLTRVDQIGMAPKYELELEVDAGRLRQQLQPLLQGGDSGFVQIVESFIDNATLLMQQQKRPGA
ncbi:putative mRNA triphosphatase Cet1, CYTH-like domain superfamily, RNA 5'-triphosphatase Cet1/Ctl1 [Septoria linicola]|nr:putative mRNA triphosphatase Cet1, CYTH-like domain superfamily, RNA 5'-triphosphatase Cet1/Ctl1 [Septoria linicola]